ncbi:MAG: glycosyltransferase, partial [Bacteroidetes bacterium]|nr:glycosyltransferase [Bacteroidota bacterium]
MSHSQSVIQIAVAMTCHNRRPKTVNCLERLYAQEGINENFSLDIFLVDDGSTDGTAQEVEKQFPQVNII